MPGIRVGHAIEVTTGRGQWGREAHRPAREAGGFVLTVEAAAGWI